METTFGSGGTLDIGTLDVTGIVLAAGAGTRAGGPKALLRMPNGSSWLDLSVNALLGGGCSRVIVVLGSQASFATSLVAQSETVTTVIAKHWERGMSESLRTGLAAAAGIAAVLTLVDLPALPVAVVQRVLGASGALRQATYGSRPGHPVYLDAAHWGPIAETVSGDRGARDYLLEHDVVEIECSDLWDGRDRNAG